MSCNLFAKPARYGYPLSGVECCKDHKEDDMKWIYKKIFCSCGYNVVYGYTDEEPTCCKRCKNKI